MAVLVKGCSSFRKKEGEDRMVAGISYQMTAVENKADEFRWLYLAEKNGRQIKIAVQGDPEGIIGTISGLNSKKGEIKFALVLVNPQNEQMNYMWDRIAGEDEAYISAAQGSLMGAAAD